MDSIRTGRLPRSARLLLGGAVLAMAVLSLALLDPARCGFFPPCPFHWLTGLWCPGCGSTRALHQLLHGHVAAAFEMNPLLVIVLPALGYLAANEIVRRSAGRPSLASTMAPAWIWAFAAVTLAFWVARNIQVPSFAWLAP